ncbi:MAG: glycosyl transferase family 1, partial [Duncaniella sp.]|nr:glycosyl transferase family 1 [Duncaniella sp.]
MNLERLLGEKGFDTAVFSMDFPENTASEWSAYFASQVEFSGPVSEKLKAVKRIFGMGDIRASFSRVLDDLCLVQISA